MYISKIFLSLFIIIVLAMPTNVLAATQNSNAIKDQQYATWLWDTQQILQSPDKILNFMSTNNVKILYLQIDYNLKSDLYKNFIKKAFMKNISVYALDGAPDWVSDNGTNNQKKFFDWLTKFQNTSSANEKFKGVHLDVEPYLNAQYSNNMNGILQNYQVFLLNALTNSNSLGLSLSIDIPFWFDGITYNTKYGTGSLADWIMKNIHNVVVMAYRDSAAGDNGIVSLASKELNLGKQYDTVITIAVETQKADEGNNISFFEEGQNYMNKELSKVYDNYKKNSSFGGFAIHDVINWMNLEK